MAHVTAVVEVLAIAVIALGVCASTSVDTPGVSTHLGACEPDGVHLSLGDNDDEMMVVWQTVSANCSTVVEYGTDGQLSTRVAGEKESFVDGGPERLVRVIHKTLLTGLLPGETYDYRAGDPGRAASWSRRFFFRAKRSPAQIRMGPPLRILAVCDMGHRESTGVLERIVAEVHKSGADMLIHCGDLAYGGTRSSSHFSRITARPAPRVQTLQTPMFRLIDVRDGD